MSLLNPGGYDLLLECIQELHTFADPAALRLWLLETALPKLAPSDWFSYNEVDLVNPANTLAIVKPESPALQNLFSRFRELVRQNPLSRLESENFPVHKTSDFLTWYEFHRLELYRAVYRLLGVEYQIAATIKLEPHRVTAFALSRRRRDYTERDRAVLELLRPHLVVAFNYLALAAEQQSLLTRRAKPWTSFPRPLRSSIGGAGFYITLVRPYTGLVPRATAFCRPQSPDGSTRIRPLLRSAVCISTPPWVWSTSGLCAHPAPNACYWC